MVVCLCGHGPAWGGVSVCPVGAYAQGVPHEDGVPEPGAVPVPVASLRCCASCAFAALAAGGAPTTPCEARAAWRAAHPLCPGHVPPQIRRMPALGGHSERGLSVAWDGQTMQEGDRPPRLALVALVLASASMRSPRVTMVRLPVLTARTSPRWIQERMVDTARLQ